MEGRTGAEDFFGGIVWEVTRDEWSEAYFVTLIDRCSFLCVSGQRGTIAKSMHEEHLRIVALTSSGARNPVLSACLLPPRVIAYTALRLCMAINVSVQYDGGLLPDIILLTQCYYHRGTRLNAMKRFCVFSY